MTSGSQFESTRSTVRAAQPAGDALHHVVLVHDARDAEVVVEVRATACGERLARRVADAVDRRADLGEAARVLIISGG